MNILLTGGMGFIGSHTAVVLIEAGHDVVLFDNLSNADRSVLDRIETITGRRPVFIEGDIRDPAAMEKLMRKLNRQKELVLETEDYKRPRAPAPSKLLEPWYRARSFTICHNDKLTDELFSRDIVERLRQDFTFLLPYYDYFVTLEGDPDPRDAAPV